MRCQERKARGYSKRSRDVPAADLAPPAHALELIPERYRRPIAMAGEDLVGGGGREPETRPHGVGNTGSIECHH